eukprot:86773-Alexandrium_andersonii.AAC.1
MTYPQTASPGVRQRACGWRMVGPDGGAWARAKSVQVSAHSSHTGCSGNFDRTGHCPWRTPRAEVASADAS